MALMESMTSATDLGCRSKLATNLFQVHKLVRRQINSRILLKLVIKEVFSQCCKKPS